MKSSNPKWHRTKDEKKLKSDFSLSHTKDIDYYEHIIDHHNVFLYDKTVSVTEKIKRAKKCLKYLTEFKEYCSVSDGGKLYFADMWEHCHNSKEECFSVYDKISEKLRYYNDNFDNLLSKESEIKTLHEDLYSYLKSHNHILQKEIYKDFNPLLKYDIQKEIRCFEKDGIIKRTKKNGSFILELAE